MINDGLVKIEGSPNEISFTAKYENVFLSLCSLKPEVRRFKK
ncbi:hypothetical protein COO91_04808 [Nostoc flagelliforme CCNUN1]|uniref:Uncharacterized protein n=1 Tax=Nostoc flagelliforme CCNUN1 TaxID=2038116 RepID=A0A2K8STR4_9NOSO|nr:hypothetical protein COO91_04808 [Nostoc flagelliforme CCNUN1]